MKIQERTIKKIKEALKNEGWILLSAIYKGKHIRIKYLCDKNHSDEMYWSNYQAGCRCKTCNVIKITDDDVKQEFAKVGWTPLEAYKNSTTYMKCKCNKNHEFYISWASFKRGTPCEKCQRSQQMFTELFKEIKL
ncbi:MAG TPA: hypothetical protein VMX17_12735 [Candidatus Glassbacteria bacterium]|nr:hypothetical protein [Candidatus Glassbacteria bacterium]